MIEFDIEAVRAQVRAVDFMRGTPAEIALWREDMAESRANLVIEDMIPTPNDDAFFDMLLDEGVSPALTVQILHRLYNHPDANPALAAITPMTTAGVESR